MTSLDVSGAQRTDSGLWSAAITDTGLETIEGLSHLQELNLSGTKVTDLGLAKLSGLKELRELDLSRTQVTAKGLENLAGLPKLERLNLTGTKRVGADALPVLAKLKASVDLTDTQIAK